MPESQRPEHTRYGAHERRTDPVTDRRTGLVVGWVNRAARALRWALRQNEFEVKEERDG